MLEEECFTGKRYEQEKDDEKEDEKVIDHHFINNIEGG